MAQPDITLPNLALRSRRRADMVGSSFCTDSEVDSYCEQSFREFYMRMVATYEDRFVKKAATAITTVAGTGAYGLASDILKFRGVRHRDEWFLGRMDLKETGFVPSQRQKPTHYWLHGQLEGAVQLEFYAVPDRAYTLDYYYVPLLSLDDVISGSLRFVAGWDEYIVLTAAAKMKDKEESDCSVLISEKQLLWDVISKSASPFDESEPFAVVQQTAGRTMRGPTIYDDPFLLEDIYGA